MWPDAAAAATAVDNAVMDFGFRFECTFFGPIVMGFLPAKIALCSAADARTAASTVVRWVATGSPSPRMTGWSTSRSPRPVLPSYLHASPLEPLELVSTRT